MPRAARSIHVKQLYLIRHAQSHYDPAVPDSERPLTKKGRRQATELAGHLRPLGIEEIYTSPFQRCLDTIRPFAEQAVLQPNHVGDLRERHFSN